MSNTEESDSDVKEPSPGIKKIEDEQIRAATRLRASKKKMTDEKYRKGEIAGSEFAMETAEYFQLERLDRFRKDCGNDYGRVIESDSFGPYGLVKLIEGEDGDPEGIWEDWREDYGDDLNYQSWLEGFIDGALSKFAELKEAI